MKRRAFILALGGAAAWPLAARAQREPARIAFLGSGAAASSRIFLDAFKQGLGDHGMTEGRDYSLDVRWAEGVYDRFPALAREVVRQDPSVVMVTTIAAVTAAQRATSTIPIVMTAINDPVGANLIASLSRPGGNTTGIANLTEDVTAKVLEILLALVPTAKTVAVLFNPANPSNRVFLEKVRALTSPIGVTVIPGELTTSAALDLTFEALAQTRPDALQVINDATILDLRERIMTLASAHRLPTVTSIPEFTDAGALAGYGPPRLDLYRRSAYYVRKILDGAKPADLPVEQPTRIELSLNMKTAKALGIILPESLLVRADRIIE
ncbi:MAG: ABC transporter substrate-binding protein [Xanthobacteraceae bacterium]